MDAITRSGAVYTLSQAERLRENARQAFQQFKRVAVFRGRAEGFGPLPAQASRLTELELQVYAAAVNLHRAQEALRALHPAIVRAELAMTELVEAERQAVQQ